MSAPVCDAPECGATMEYVREWLHPTLGTRWLVKEYACPGCANEVYELVRNHAEAKA